MSDQRTLNQNAPIGDIEHTAQLSRHIGALHECQDYSDIQLVVEGTRFRAHKVILAARSDYFRALLFGGMRESQPDCTEISLQNTNPVAFGILLRYLYTGCLRLSEIKEEGLLDVLGLAHQYNFVDLEKSVSEYLNATLSIRNVCLVYDIANLYQLAQLCNTCLNFVDANAGEVISTDGFLSLSEAALKTIVQRDSFAAPEIDIFHAVCRWSERNPEANCRSIMDEIRLPLMKLGELLNVVRPSECASPDRILDAIQVREESRDMELNYRGMKLPEENVAIAPKAIVIRGEIKNALLDGDTTNYDLDRGFTRHPIDENCINGIVVKLDRPYIINSINILLWDKDQRSYSYYIEVSMDDDDYVKVVDHRKYLCRSWQRLYFPSKVCQFIRIVGTHNTVNRVFHVVSLAALYTHHLSTLHDGLIVPTENVASIRQSACVIEGVSRSRNALINGDVDHYDWDSGYTCHQLGSGAIVVQLAQPYIISSMRLLLWDCDDRSYSYYIEVSVNNQTWHKVADKTKQPCKSWQVITFKPRPVTFVKVVGTHNTANEVFHCVHFECPCPPDALAKHRAAVASEEERARSAAAPIAPTNQNLPSVSTDHVAQPQHVPNGAAGSSGQNGLENTARSSPSPRAGPSTSQRKSASQATTSAGVGGGAAAAPHQLMPDVLVGNGRSPAQSNSSGASAVLPASPQDNLMHQYLGPGAPSAPLQSIPRSLEQYQLPNVDEISLRVEEIAPGDIQLHCVEESVNVHQQQREDGNVDAEVEGAVGGLDPAHARGGSSRQGNGRSGSGRSGRSKDHRK